MGEALAFALDRPWWLPDRVLHWDRRAPRVIESADGSGAGAGMNGEGERQGNGRVRLPKLETGGYRLAKINVEKFVNGAKAARESRLARAADASRVASLRGSETEEQQRTSGLPPSPFDQARSETIDDMASAAETYHTIGSVTPSRSSTAATLRRMATRGARTASRAALSSMGIDLAPTVEYDESVVRVNEQGVPVVGGGFIPYEGIVSEWGGVIHSDIYATMH